ncbi:MAG: hypothetical protein IPJ77_23400 [Planctomycetes bacterium]|nr:hypothetical protein [Planctomycetota bacterium]
MSTPKLYKAVSSEGCTFCAPASGRHKDAELAIFDRLDGNGSGKLPEIEIVRFDNGSVLRDCDMPDFHSSLLVMNARALRVLSETLAPCGVVGELPCRDGQYYVFACNVMADAVDLTMSDCLRLDTGRAYMIIKHVFVPQRIPSADVFQLQVFGKSGPLYFSDNIVSLIKQAKLTGLEFQRL